MIVSDELGRIWDVAVERIPPEVRRAWALKDWIVEREKEMAPLPRWHRRRRRIEQSVKTKTREAKRFDRAAYSSYVFSAVWDFVDDGSLTEIIFGTRKPPPPPRSKYRYA